MSFLILVSLAALIGWSYYRDHQAELACPPMGDFHVIDGLKIHYRDLPARQESDKIPVLFIHGSSCNLRDLEIALAEKLTEDRRVILVDRPGHGYSEGVEDGYRLDVQARCIQKLKDQLKLSQVIIAGHSYGGSVALRYALDYPHDLAGLLLLSPVSHQWPGGVAVFNHVASWPILGWVFRRTIVPLYASFVGRAATEKAFWPHHAPDQYFDKAGMALMFRNSEFRAITTEIKNLYDQISLMQHRYGEIKHPVRILAGTHDTTVLSTLHSESLWNEIDNADFSLVPDVGHPLPHRAQYEIAEALKELDVAIRDDMEEGRRLVRDPRSAQTDIVKKQISPPSRKTVVHGDNVLTWQPRQH